MIKMAVAAIVGAVDAAAARWRDTGFVPRRRVRDAVAARTGYSLATIEYAFDRLFEGLTYDAMTAVIADELGCIDVLDGFVERAGRPRIRALPIGRVCIIASRTTVGVALVPAVFALAAKCTVLVKDREDLLAAAFFDTLGEERPELRDAMAARSWHGDGDALDLRDFEAVVAFGENATMEKLAQRLTPPTRFIPFGAKASAGYIGRQALSDEAAASAIASRAARDLVLYESEGCLSLHALFVENAGAVSPQRFGELFADSVRYAAAEFPHARDAWTSARLALARELALFRGGSEGVYAVANLEEPPLFLPRAIAVRAVDRPSEALQYLQSHRIELETLAVAGNRSDITALAMQTMVSRIAPFGAMQSPPLRGFHGGRPRIAEFVRWIADET